MSKSQADLSEDLTQSFARLIAEHTGLALRDLDRTGLGEKLSIRTKALKLLPENYYRLLAASTPESTQEWQKLVALFTNNETYFFRDKEQFHLLRNFIIPELIRQKQATRNIRICSAGCSSGEEPYSLAMLLKEIIPDVKHWNLMILGIDIDEEALEKAKRGIYSPWSFRGVDSSVKDRYFRPINNQYHLVPEIKQLVNFQTVNLVKDSFPQRNSELKNIDLFICRNVFIYFGSATIALILEKIYRTLNPLGYFLTGHTELHGQLLRQFEKKIFTESLIYQRPENDVVDSAPTILPKIPSSTKKLATPTNAGRFNSAPAARKTPNLLNSRSVKTTVSRSSPPTEAKENSDNLLEKAKILCQQKQYELAIKQVKKVLDSKPKHIQANYLIAEIYANLGKYEEAVYYCYQALEQNSCFVFPYYLLAQIAEEQGNSEEAKRILKKIIYLDPNSPLPYFDLSQIYQREGDQHRMIKMQQAALDLLKPLPSGMKIKEELTVAELVAQLEKAG